MLSQSKLVSRLKGEPSRLLSHGQRLHICGLPLKMQPQQRHRKWCPEEPSSSEEGYRGGLLSVAVSHDLWDPWTKVQQGQSNLGTQTLSYSFSLLLFAKPCVSSSPIYIRRKVGLCFSLPSYIFNHLIGFHYKILHARNSFGSHLAGGLVPASRRWPLLCITSSLR